MSRARCLATGLLVAILIIPLTAADLAKDEAETIGALVMDLDDDTLSAREAAQEVLAEMGRAYLARSLRAWEAIKTAPDAETQFETFWGKTEEAWTACLQKAKADADKKKTSFELTARYEKVLAAFKADAVQTRAKGGAGLIGQSKDFPAFNKAEQLLVADLTKVQWGPVAMSYPPIYTAQLTLTVVESLRGPRKKGETFQAAYSKRQMQRPDLANGRYVVRLAKSRGTVRMEGLHEATDATLKVARAAASKPIGWKPGDGDVLLAGKGITMAVEHAPPAKAIKWTNPDGDGEYKITVTNTTDQDKPVGALLNDGKQILWAESIRVMCQNKTQPLPRARPKLPPTRPTVLKAGQSVSTVVNILPLKDLQWPRGGYRIEFKFILGELAVTKSLYYMSRHHDKLREEAVKKLEQK